jgi:hypothetical protein
MKQKMFYAALITGLLFSCSNGDTSEENKDSANTLQDTFPANGLNDSMPADSNPPDKTYVDSMQKLSR